MSKYEKNPVAYEAAIKEAQKIANEHGKSVYLCEQTDNGGYHYVLAENLKDIRRKTQVIIRLVHPARVPAQ